MKPSARRRVERELQSIIESHGDNCSICNRDFPHNCKTFGGLTASGVVALVGECCVRKVSEIVISGLYVDHPYDVLDLPGGSSTDKTASPAELEKHIEGLRGRITGLDKIVSGALRNAGRSRNKVSVSTLGNAWKTDDAAWFKANPKRSHRLRAMFPGEKATLFDRSGPPVPPPGHEFQVLVRQIEVGTRMRVQFCRNIEVPIPDLEALIHAAFDIVSADRDKQGVISVKELAELAMVYSANLDSSKPS